MSLVASGALQAQYGTDGFVIARGVVPEQLRGELLQTTAGVYRKYRPRGPAVAPESWDDPQFHEAMIELRANDPASFGALYDTVQGSLALQRLMTCDTVAEVAAELLGDTVAGLAGSGHNLRMDVPGDTRNRLGWHQEASYYPQNRRAENGLVCWIPVFDLALEDGPVVVCPGSHHGGAVAAEAAAKTGYLTSEQLEVPVSEIQRYEEAALLCNAGDAVFFHMHLFHRSGENSGSRIRFSCGIRFHRMTTDDFVPGRYVFKPNELVA